MKTEIKVKVSMTAKEWELYSITGAADAARKLSVAASKAINEAHKVYSINFDEDAAKSSAWSIWNKVSNELGEFGSNDTEPRWQFSYLLEKLFCKPHGIKY